MKTVSELMTEEVVTAHVDDKLLVADRLMKLRRCRHMPVLDGDGNLVGLVSQRDLFFNGIVRALGFPSHEAKSVLESLKISESMHTDVETIEETASVASAAQKMLSRQVGCLIVLDNAGTIKGIVTEADFVRVAAEAE